MTSQLTSRGCSKAFQIATFNRAFEYALNCYEQGESFGWPYSSSLVSEWIYKATEDMKMHPEMDDLYGGGTSFDAEDISTYWNLPAHFFTWVKNNIERKAKFQGMLVDAQLDSMKVATNNKFKSRATFCDSMVRLVLNIQALHTKSLEACGRPQLYFIAHPPPYLASRLARAEFTFPKLPLPISSKPAEFDIDVVGYDGDSMDMGIGDPSSSCHRKHQNPKPKRRTRKPTKFTTTFSQLSSVKPKANVSFGVLKQTSFKELRELRERAGFPSAVSDTNTYTYPNLRSNEAFGPIDTCNEHRLSCGYTTSAAQKGDGEKELQAGDYGLMPNVNAATAYTGQLLSRDRTDSVVEHEPAAAIPSKVATISPSTSQLSIDTDLELPLEKWANLLSPFDMEIAMSPNVVFSSRGHFAALTTRSPDSANTRALSALLSETGGFFDNLDDPCHDPISGSTGLDIEMSSMDVGNADMSSHLRFNPVTIATVTSSSGVTQHSMSDRPFPVLSKATSTSPVHLSPSHSTILCSQIGGYCPPRGGRASLRLLVAQCGYRYQR